MHNGSSKDINCSKRPCQGSWRRRGSLLYFSLATSGFVSEPPEYGLPNCVCCMLAGRPILGTSVTGFGFRDSSLWQTSYAILMLLVDTKTRKCEKISKPKPCLDLGHADLFTTGYVRRRSSSSATQITSTLPPAGGVPPDLSIPSVSPSNHCGPRWSLMDSDYHLAQVGHARCFDSGCLHRR